MLDVRWYVARARAMSPAELAWRAGAGLRVALLDGRARVGEPTRFDDSRLRQALVEVAEAERAAVVEAAGRIAGGELSLWGKPVELAGRLPPWDVDPLTGDSWGSGSWRGSGRDPKAVWELHHLKHLVTLAAGAVLSGRDDWARLVVDQSLDWIERNPRGEGIGWASAYEAGHRLVAWALALPLVAEYADEASLARLGAAMAEHRAFVEARPSRFSSANNHRLVELTGLIAGSLLTPGRPGWEALWAELEDEACRQTYTDGGSREQAGGYFLYALEILWVAGLLGRASGRPPGRLDERLRAMLGWLGAVAGRDGEPPPLGDDAEDRLFRLDYFEPRRADTLARRVAGLLDVAPPAPTVSSVVLAESGYAVLRSGEARVVFDIGELGYTSIAAHGHADALSVLVDVGGRWLLRDTGTGSYVHGRDDDRATAFHNTVVVEGESQAVSLGPHLWGRRYSVRLEAAALAPELDYVRASHDGYRAHGARHTRSVLRLGADLLVVLDRVTAPEPVRVDLVWQPGPGLPDGPAVAAETPVACERLPGRFSPRYLTTEPATRLVWARRGADVVYASAVPLDGSAVPPLSLERRGNAAVAEVGGRRVTEDWSAPVPTVEPAPRGGEAP